MDINIFDEKPKNAKTAAVISDSTEMKALLTKLISPFFTTVDKNADLYVICCEKKPPEDIPPTARMICIGPQKALFKKDAVIMERPLDIGLFVSRVRELSKEDHHELGSKAVSVDQKNKCALFNGEKISLSKKETELFSLLLKNAGRCVSRDEIESCLWGKECPSNSADVYICLLRKKLERAVGEGVLISVRGRGYMLKV